VSSHVSSGCAGKREWAGARAAASPPGPSSLIPNHWFEVSAAGRRSGMFRECVRELGVVHGIGCLALGLDLPMQSFIFLSLLLVSALFAPAAEAQTVRSVPSSDATSAAEDEFRPSYWVGAQLHAHFLSALLDKEPLQLGAGFALTGGIEFERAGLTLVLENTWFPEAELDVDAEETFEGVAQGVLALLVGFDVRYASDRLRFQLAAGPTLLLRNTLVDEAGTIGLGFESRPVGIRVPLPRFKTLVVDPLAFSMLIPDFSGIPLLLVQVRTTVTIEFDLSR
jgi:hypothetical protein